MATEFKKWWDDFRSRTNQQAKHIEFLKEKAKELNLHSVRTMISVGAGEGDVDVPMIKHSIPNLISYTALEPNDDNRQGLQKRLENECPHLQTKLIPETFPPWQGPRSDGDEKVDLVLALQVLWYFEDKGQAITDMMRWIKPGGALILGHTCDDFIFARLLERFAFENGEKEYFSPELKADLNKIKITNYDEFLVPCHFSTVDPDERMLRFIVAADRADIDESRMRTCLEKAKTLCKERQPLAHFNSVFIRIQKPIEEL